MAQAQSNQLPAGWSTLPPGWSAAPPVSGGETTDAAQDQTSADPGLLDQLAQWGAKTFPQISKADAAKSDLDALNPSRGPAPELTRILTNTGTSFLRGATALPAAAADWVKQGFDPDQYLHPLDYERKRLQQNGAAAPKVLSGPPQLSEEDYADAASDAAGNTALGVLAGEATGGLLRIPGAVKDFVRGDVDAPITGSTITPRQRFNAAKRLGVNLDAADATNSPFLGNIKRIGENSLFGGPSYDTLKAGNTSALQDSMSSFLNDLYEGDRESGGRAIQDALKRNHQSLRSGAEGGFAQLTDETKGQPVKGAPGVGATAKALLKTIDPLAEKYPSLAPGKTIHVLNDLSRVGAEPRPVSTGFLDAPGSEFAVPRETTPPRPDTWADLQRLRSATHDLTTTNPDLVKSQALAPLQVMTSALDDAMTNASSGLTPQQEAIFRRANADWKDMKETYDNPSSPFHHAVRTDSPSTLFSGVGPRTPENAMNLTRRLSPFEDFPEGPSDALGALRRGTVESALKTNAEGAPNYGSFGKRWNDIPADYRAELFGPDQNAKLRDITHTSNVLAKDFNPSGSGKLTQKVLEGSALGTAVMGSLFNPTAALGAVEPLLQYPVAKIMTNPRAVEFLMAPSRRPNPLFAPAAGVAAATAPKRKKLADQ